jgi:hypothetical protein
MGQLCSWAWRLYTEHGGWETREGQAKWAEPGSVVLGARKWRDVESKRGGVAFFDASSRYVWWWPHGKDICYEKVGRDLWEKFAVEIPWCLCKLYTAGLLCSLLLSVTTPDWDSDVTVQFAEFWYGYLCLQGSSLPCTRLVFLSVVLEMGWDICLRKELVMSLLPVDSFVCSSLDAELFGFCCCYCFLFVRFFLQAVTFFSSFSFLLAMQLCVMWCASVVSLRLP